MPSDSEQIRALLDGSGVELVLRTLGKSRLDPGDYERVITVSAESVVDYLLRNTAISDIADSNVSQKDGYFAIIIPGGWEVYEQERGCRLNTSFATTEKQVFEHFVEHHLQMRPSANS